jgi:hypothetical protein
LESFALFYSDFCMDLYSVVSDEAMKRGKEALNASWRQFLSSVKSSSLHRYSFFLALNASSSLHL